MEGGSDRFRGAAHRSGAAARKGGRQLHLVRGIQRSALLLQRESTVAGQELRAIAGGYNIGGSYAAFGGGAASETRAGRTGSACVPSRTATRTSAGGGHRSPDHGRRRQGFAAPGKSG